MVTICREHTWCTLCIVWSTRFLHATDVRLPGILNTFCIMRLEELMGTRLKVMGLGELNEE